MKITVATIIMNQMSLWETFLCCSGRWYNFGRLGQFFQTGQYWKRWVGLRSTRGSNFGPEIFLKEFSITCWIWYKDAISVRHFSFRNGPKLKLRTESESGSKLYLRTKSRDTELFQTIFRTKIWTRVYGEKFSGGIFQNRINKHLYYYCGPTVLWVKREMKRIKVNIKIEVFLNPRSSMGFGFGIFLEW